MLKRENGYKKIIATCLIFVFVFANCFTIFANVSYAETSASKNINYDVNFVQAEEKIGHEFEATITEDSLAIALQVKVEQEGYLKNAQILIEAENGLSFEMEDVTTDSYKIEGNKISLSNISSEESVEIIAPIKYRESEKIDNLSKTINAKLIGTYVDNSGTERSVSENIPLKAVWNTNTEFNITSDLKKYIPYKSDKANGIILQTSVKSWIPEKNNFVGKEEIKIDPIKIDGYKVEKVILANKTGEPVSEKSWSVNEEGQVNIKIEKTDVAIETNELLVTYIFSGNKKIEKPLKVATKINGSVFMFGTDEKTEYELEAEYELNETIGKIISLEAEGTDSIKLGNILTNSASKENNYKTEYTTKVKVDISSTEMVENILIKDVSENFENEKEKVKVNSSKTKKVSVSEDNFKAVLGESGKIEIANEKGEVVGNITKDHYSADVDAQKISIKTTKPVKEGILVIDLNKEIAKENYTYEQIKTFSNLDITYAASYILNEGVENNIGTANTKVELVKPETNAELSISNKKLSTVAENKDIELVIKLNNNNENNDLYKNPEFTITFPEYIKDVNVTNLAIANAEEVFNIKEATIDVNKEGNIVLNVKVDGAQTKYNENNITSGTNIIINSDITLDLYAPNKKDNIVLTYTNENATKYKNITESGVAFSYVEIEYKAPVGMVSINKISNYENTGKTITSVEQGVVTDKIEIFDDEKIAKMDIIVMNNNENSCKDIRILGRIPFKGNKDFETGKDLGTTIDTELYGSIVENQNNKASATIYYSENEEATDDLESSKNGWTTDVNSIDAKSYLIIPNEYEMEAGDILQYSYNYEIPSNLEHNTDIYSSFETIYENETDVASKKEVSTADVVGLTTGTGPQMEIETKTNISGTMKEYEKVKYTIEIKNTGTDVAENIVVKTTIPQWSTLAVHSTAETVENDKGWKLKSDREITTTIKELAAGETKNVEFYVQANKLPSIEEYYANTEGFTKNADGTYSINGEKIEGIPEVKLVCKSTITATDLAKEITTENEAITVTKSNLVAEETVSTIEPVARVNETIEAKIKIKNNSNETMKNVKVTKALPEGLKYSEAYVCGYEADGLTLKKIKSVTYNETTRMVTWTVNEINPGRTVLLIGNFVTADLENNVYEKVISTISNIEVNGEKYQAGQVDITVGKPHLEITQTSNKTNQYIKVGDDIEYTFNIKNTGSVRANDVSFVDTLPEEVTIKKLSYVVDGVAVSKVVAKNEDATIYTNILPSGSLDAKITARVNDIQGKQKTITNTADVEGKEITKLSSNKVENIIERTAQDDEPGGNGNGNNNGNGGNNGGNQGNNNGEVKSKYEIKGLVWLENNKDGKREITERKLPGIEVRLINAITGTTIEKMVTTADGEYIFKNLENGKYQVMFYYDSSRYGITEYNKQGVSADVNSDVISAKDNNKTVAITDVITINNGSKSNIDMGLIEAKVFDLALSKRITKVTVQDNSGTKSYNFNKTDLAKVDINAKNLNGAKVFIEYDITVKNEGEVEGYAKQIVDYMPKELEFTTDLNKGWYKGSDGNLYTESLSNTPIAAGHSETVKLVLTKTMTETNTGIINNQAEISEDYNKAGISDKDSEVRNKDQKEDDMSAADMIIGVKTGDTLIYITVITAITILGIIAAIAIKRSKLIYKIQAKLGKEV